MQLLALVNVVFNVGLKVLSRVDIETDFNIVEIFLFVKLFNPLHVTLDGVDIENGSFSDSENFLDFIFVKHPGVAFYEYIPDGGFFRYPEGNRFTAWNVLSFYPDVVKVTHLIDGF